MELEKLTNNELVEKTESLRGKEKRILWSLLLYLGEVDERKLYRDIGYSSFFVFLTSHLGYAKASAYRRVVAARLLRKRPELFKELTSGRLSFSALVELAKCEKSRLGELVKESAGKSHEEISQLVQREVAPKKPLKRKEKIRVVRCETPSPVFETPIESSRGSAPEPISESELRYEVAFQADEEFMKMYREAKALAGGSSMKEVFSKLLRDFTKRNSPKERVKRREERKAPVRNSTGRHIPAAVRDEVVVRDGGCCSYVSPLGVKCTEREHLEVDHVKPFALGGESTPENLRLLCRAHNQLMAERVYGKTYIERKRIH